MANFNIDPGREKRIGFPQVVYGVSKSVADLKGILENYVVNGNNGYDAAMSALGILNLNKL